MDAQHSPATNSPVTPAITSSFRESKKSLCLTARRLGVTFSLHFVGKRVA